jgi:hypothetical protein
VWSVKFEVWSAKSAVWREGQGPDRLFLKFRSFIFGKLLPPACPRLCLLYVYLYILGMGGELYARVI